MKTTVKVIALTILLSFDTFAQNVGINETGATPDESALLDLNSTNKGFLITRADTADINSPAFGLMTLAPKDSCLYMQNGKPSGKTWISQGGPGYDCPCVCSNSCETPSDLSATTSANPICEGNTLTLNGDATDATSYSWTGPNGFTSADQNPTLTSITAAGAGIYTLTASNDCGDETISTASVTVTESPNAGTLSGNQIVCDGATTNFSSTQSGGSWSSSNTGTAIVNTSTGDVTGVSAGTATITYTITGTEGCSDAKATRTVTVTSCCRNTETTVNEVYNPSTGKTWMDRNLGADQIPSNKDDNDGFGDLYQWGRCKDGHEDVNSPTTTTPSNSNNPGHGKFITTSDADDDWRSPKNDNLWQGASGINNPCPVDYRIPTKAELEAEQLSWNSQNPDGAYGSPLKIPSAGYRMHDGNLFYFNNGNYWSSTIDGAKAFYLNFSDYSTGMLSTGRAFGRSVRCIKN